MSSSPRLVIHAFIRGQVQGVWYRGWTVETATALCLDGWVRNRSDGSVEALFAGPADKVNEMLLRCLSGPPEARVTGIDRREGDEPGQTGFRQVATV
ncbi:acylphosphatase [Radicibacter daui]|uniref:acylphosphatase n=1 Tax=Radicibacter daui TaxID=3064829 RepID=UPI004046988D